MLRKHEQMESVAAEFLKVFQVPGQDRYKIRVRWWNIGKCHEPWNMNITQNFDLTGEQVRKFKPYHFTPLTSDAAVGLPSGDPQERSDEIV
jgi:hypothetical protein